MYFDSRCAPRTVVKRSFQSLKVPVSSFVTELYAFMPKVEELSTVFPACGMVAMAVECEER